MDSDSEGEIYEVDYIMDQRGRGRTLEYFVRWKGYGEEEDSWEPARGLKSAKAAVDDFLKGKTPAKTPSKKFVAMRVESPPWSSSTRDSKSGSKRGTTTRTTTTSYSRMSDASSPESSPVLSRKTVTSTRRVEVTQTRGGSRSDRRRSLSERLPVVRVPRFVQQACREVPIMIMVASMVVLALTFVFEKQINKLLK